MKFYPHDMMKARQDAEDRRECAAIKHPYLSDKWHKEICIRQLEQVAQIGLPSCYCDLEDFLVDWFMDFSWNERAVNQIQLVLDDPRFPGIADRINPEWGIDLAGELRKAQEEMRACA